MIELTGVLKDLIYDLSRGNKKGRITTIICIGCAKGITPGYTWPEHFEHGVTTMILGWHEIYWFYQLGVEIMWSEER